MNNSRCFSAVAIYYFTVHLLICKQCRFVRRFLIFIFCSVLRILFAIFNREQCSHSIFTKYNFPFVVPFLKCSVSCKPMVSGESKCICKCCVNVSGTHIIRSLHTKNKSELNETIEASAFNEFIQPASGTSIVEHFW